MSYTIVSPSVVAPMVLTVTRSGTGGISGLSPTVAFRKAATTNEYLDWNDLTFKTVGWTIKNASMIEIGGGHYQRRLDLTTISAADGDQYVAEYDVPNVGSQGVDSDVFIIEDAAQDTEFMRKMVTNRIEQTSGNPGILELYDDDGTTVLYRWQLRDEAGNGIVAIQGASARRSQGTPGP